ncbi:UMP-CMP kinase, putative [Eimeria mitis]|uniref:UMP-CMP kinase, putative n=1 Tax=Eimeria mitis TaxID=44415 RepID=U6K012_9EIME|nr:UMP-CMP kinase, putative [Eimeria mitis]CDJ29098.1 UMP-CMP kinase, putative [Eimeria mitis]
MQIFVLGGPGAGKGTQCSLIEKEFSIPHISAGRIVPVKGLGAHSTSEDNIVKGRIVPVKITLSRVYVLGAHSASEDNTEFVAA